MDTLYGQQRSFTLALVLSLVFTTAQAGSRFEFEQQSYHNNTGKPAQTGKGRYQLEIEGSGFHLINAHVIETSQDDGATTLFDSKPGIINTPLFPETPTWADPIAGIVKDHQIIISTPIPGPPWLDYTTRWYTVDQKYTVVARVGWIFSRSFAHHDRYEISIVDTDISPAAVRVALTRGYGRNLGLHPEAFLGFPIKIVGHLSSREVIKNASEMTTEFQLQALSMTPWTPANKLPE
ncbi:MAG: hypothetical protein V4495_17715 [Pseudomonadota bacterium]